MKEITITTNKISHASSSIGIWNWEVPVYLFLGGLTAGIIIIASVLSATNLGKKYPFAANKIIFSVPIIMSLGMFALFLDLTHKLYVWRFYTAFKITSVMSWGSWILILVYPLSILLAFATFREGYPKVYEWTKGKISDLLPKFIFNLFETIIRFSEKYKSKIAVINIPVGIGLGIYTGILLSAFSARPFWNSGLLGPLFLVSGLSTAVAAVILFAKEHNEKKFFTKIDLGLIGVELGILILFIIGMLNSSVQHSEAVSYILGGDYTHLFWIFIIGIGLTIPAFLEWLELRGKHIPSAIAASMVLTGGLVLRFVFVELGQVTTWLPY